MTKFRKREVIWDGKNHCHGVVLYVGKSWVCHSGLGYELEGTTDAANVSPRNVMWVESEKER